MGLHVDVHFFYWRRVFVRRCRRASSGGPCRGNPASRRSPATTRSTATSTATTATSAEPAACASARRPAWSTEVTASSQRNTRFWKNAPWEPWGNRFSRPTASLFILDPHLGWPTRPERYFGEKGPVGYSQVIMDVAGCPNVKFD